ncbi:protein involved in propionate catabolism [Rhizobium sp. R72]|nr:protein involved in propionate catabolism [Rhizobium sp. R72]OWW02499.1 protein involved in propionate catabolism [Rhizobium sp. R711]
MTQPGDECVATILADYCNGIRQVPIGASRRARRTLLDTLGVAAAGSRTQAGRASLKAAGEIWGEGAAPVWFSKRRLPAVGSAFVNATYAAALDLDDGHRQASGHPAAAIVPAVLAVATCCGASADRLLSAIVLGYEIAVRVSAARDIKTLRTTDTGLWCGPGVAAACGWLTGQPTAVIAHAIAIAGQTATSQAATGWTKLGHTVKEGIPWATANGLQAVALARAGHRGPLDMLDDPAIYDRQRLLRSWSRAWAIEEAYFKLYSCCRWAHAAIDGASMLAARLDADPDEIEDLVIETFERALTLPNQIEPQSAEAAQYSIPFCVALALVHGQQALLPMDDGHLCDIRVTALAGRIRLQSARDYAASFPAGTPARVTMRARGRSETIEVLYPRGEPQNPLSAEELQEKFLTLSSALGRDQASDVSAAVEGLGIHQNPAALFEALSRCS